MRITITMEQVIKILNIAVHTVSLIIGILAGVLYSSEIPNIHTMYIGKALLIYFSIIIVGYIVSRFLFCMTFRPVIRQMKKRMSI